MAGVAMRGPRSGLVLALSVLAAGALPSIALAQGSEEMRSAIPDPQFDIAKAAFEALPAPDRAAIQDALVWTGDYASAPDGTFGRRTFEAIQSWQRRARRPTTGLLDRPGFAALVTTGQKARDAVGFAIVADAASGVRIGIPQRLLPRRSPNTIGGTRFQSADERVTLDTRSQPGSAEDLRALYERNLAIQTAGRAVTYKLLRPDFFVIAGETPGGRFYSRYAQEGSAIRGFSIGYGKALAPEFDRVTVAIANSFQPFGPATAQPGAMAERPAASPAGDVRASPPTPAASFTGLAVSARRVVAPAAVQEACREPRLDATPARIVSSGGGLVVLEPASPRRSVPLTFATSAGEGAATVLFFASGEGGRAVVAPAEIVAAGRVIAPLQEGGAGAVVLDRSGAILGMVGPIGTGRVTVAGLVPPASYRFVAAATLRELADGGAVAPAAPSGTISLGSAASAVMPALVRITCPAPVQPVRPMESPASSPSPNSQGGGKRF